MNEQVLKQILDKLSNIESRLNILEREAKDSKYPNMNPDPSYWQRSSVGDSITKGGCLFDSVKPGNPMGMSCPCPKCSPYSVSITKFEAQDRDGGRLSDCARRFDSPLTKEQWEIIRKASPTSGLSPDRRTAGIFDGKNGNGYQPLPHPERWYPNKPKHPPQGR